jgi:hypothetical protein
MLLYPLPIVGDSDAQPIQLFQSCWSGRRFPRVGLISSVQPWAGRYIPVGDAVANVKGVNPVHGNMCYTDDNTLIPLCSQGF